ncbi:metallophosphoesterase [Cystobacter fuscus]
MARSWARAPSRPPRVRTSRACTSRPWGTSARAARCSARCSRCSRPSARASSSSRSATTRTPPGRTRSSRATCSPPWRPCCGAPLFPTPGNHEYLTSNAQPYLDSFYLPANNSARTERYYSFDWGPVHFVSLDSNCLTYPTPECTKAIQQDWVAKDLAATPRPWKIVFFHHPLWSSGEHGSSTSMRKAFAATFEQYGVDLVLTGHDHNYERSKPMKGEAVAASGTKGIPYLVVGSGGATMRPFDTSQPSWSAFRDDTNVGFLDVTVDGGTLTAKFITSSNTVRDSLTLTKTVSASVKSTLSSAAPASDTPPGPVDSPYRQPAFLEQGPVPPADTAESVADQPEPAHQFVHDQP